MGKRTTTRGSRCGGTVATMVCPKPWAFSLPVCRHGRLDRLRALNRKPACAASSTLYKWTGRMVAARKKMLKSLTADGNGLDVVNNLHSENAFFSFSRGGAVVVVGSQQTIATPTNAAVQTSLPPNVRLCDALQPDEDAPAATPPAPAPSPLLQERPPHASDTCSPESTRRDCGMPIGKSQQSCEAAGCCWGPVNPNPGNKPWCFHKSGPPGPPPPPVPPLARCTTTDANGVVHVRLEGEPRVFLREEL